MILIPVNLPKITKATLKEPQHGCIMGIGFTVTCHYFCEGDGEKAQAIYKEDAYRFWLEKQQNKWWKRLLGKPKYKIPMREQVEDDIYSSYEVVDTLN